MKIKTGNCYTYLTNKNHYFSFIIAEVYKEFTGAVNLGLTPLDIKTNIKPTLTDLASSKYFEAQLNDIKGPQVYNVWEENFNKESAFLFVGNIEIDQENYNTINFGPIKSNVIDYLSKVTQENFDDDRFSLEPIINLMD